MVATIIKCSFMLLVFFINFSIEFLFYMLWLNPFVTKLKPIYIIKAWAHSDSRLRNFDELSYFRQIPPTTSVKVSWFSLISLKITIVHRPKKINSRFLKKNEIHELHFRPISENLWLCTRVILIKKNVEYIAWYCVF